MSHINLFFRGLLFTVFLLCAICVLTGCSDGGADLFVSGDTFKLSLEDEFDYESYLDGLKAASDSAAALNAVTATADTVPTDTEPDDHGTSTAEAVVYWVKTGEVWHTRSDCSSLSRSKSIIAGSVETAEQCGKMRACKRCGG